MSNLESTGGASSSLNNRHASPEDVGINFQKSASAVVFERNAGPLLVDPSQLDAIREVSDRGLSIVIEEARWHKDAKIRQRLSQFGSQEAADNNSDVDDYERVIVKSYRPNFITTTVELNSIVDEAKRIASLKHSNMIHLLGFGCYNTNTAADLRSSLFYVEEFAGSWSLFKMLRSKWLHPTHPHVQFTPADCFRWCINIADVLAYLHLHKVVHRDIKAENIFLTDTDVSETIARIGDLKPHRRNFRKYAHGHLRTTRSRDLIDPEIDEQSDSGPTSRLASSVHQFSLSRHNSIAVRQLRPQRSTIAREDTSDMTIGQAAAPGLPAPAAQHISSHPADSVGSRSLKMKELSSSFRLRHNNEALPLLVQKEHPNLDATGDESFVKAVEQKMEDEKLEAETLKRVCSLEREGREEGEEAGSKRSHKESKEGVAAAKDEEEPQPEGQPRPSPRGKPSMWTVLSERIQAAQPSPFRSTAQVAWTSSQDMPDRSTDQGPKSTSPALSGQVSGSAFPPSRFMRNSHQVTSTGGSGLSDGAAEAGKNVEDSAARNAGSGITKRSSVAEAAAAAAIAAIETERQIAAQQAVIEDGSAGATMQEGLAGATSPDRSADTTTQDTGPEVGNTDRGGTQIESSSKAKQPSAATSSSSAAAAATEQDSQQVAATTVRIDEDKAAVAAGPVADAQPSVSPGALEAQDSAQPSVKEKRRKSMHVTFREGIPEGLPSSEDYSLVYAPPEYVGSMSCDTLQALGPKGDVFSFSKIMYEVMTQRLINPAATVGAPEGWHTTSEVLYQYAAKVKEGFREPIPDKWPQSVRALIEQCWAEDPSKRPGMQFVANRLRELAADAEVLADLEPPTPPPEPAKEEEEEWWNGNDDDEDEEAEDDLDGENKASRTASGGEIHRASSGPLARISGMLGRTSAGLTRHSAGGGIARNSVKGPPSTSSHNAHTRLSDKHSKDKLGCGCGCVVA